MLDMKESNPDLWREIWDHDAIRACFTCGACVSGCPAAEADPPLLIRSLVRKVVLGLEDSLLDDDTPWTCVTCSRCEEFCPMGVRPFELGIAIRQWQCENDESRIPPASVEVFQRGYTQAVGKDLELRKSVGLTERLPTLDQRPELLKRFQAMLGQVEIIQDNDYMFVPEGDEG